MNNITKKNLVEKVAIRTGLTQIDTKIVVECFLDALSSSLVQGNGIEIRGFGRFKIKEKRPRNARNPRTSEIVKVKGGVKPVFEPARNLKERVNAALATKRGRRG